MAKGQHLSRHQQGIVRRYYEHLDTITLQRLGEIVSDLYLADSPKKTEQLWKRAEKALAKAAANEQAVRATLQSRDVTKLARLVNEMTVEDGKRSQ